MKTEYKIELCNITKRFPGVLANDRVNLQIKKGEIHALLGENGAGKSTLMSILFGLYQPDEGYIKVDGKKVQIKKPQDAAALGIGMVHQHFQLIPNFTVLQNVILGNEETNSGILEMKRARRQILALSETYHFSVDPDAKIQDLSVGMQQRVEILKMLWRNREVLIFDEPTAVLAPQEIARLLDVLKQLADEGKTILFITHKLNEIRQAADRCSVLRRGKYIGTVDVSSADQKQLAEMMVGRAVRLHAEKKAADPAEAVLAVQNVTVQNKRRGHTKELVKNVSFQVRRGEIVCIAGIEGNGQMELAEAVTGMRRVDGGTIVMKETDVTKRSVRFRNTHGMSHIPQDRQKHGLVMEYSAEKNLILQEYFKPRFQKYGFIRRQAVEDYAAELTASYEIRGGEASVRGMSGGNQQKVILAREISRKPDLLVAVQPTRGLDVGAIEFVHRQIIRERDAGAAVLLVSLELEEVFHLSDRILVMYEGEIAAEVTPGEITPQELGLYMSGAKRK